MRDMIPDILKYIHSHMYDEITIEEISEHFGYSKFHFSREFKKSTGFSAADYLSSLKIESAKKEFLEHKRSITDSSFDAGFSSLGTFSTTFTKKTGMSPPEYKDQVETLYDLTEHCRSGKDEIGNRIDKKHSSNDNRLKVTIHYSENDRSGITFIGLFNSAIPNHKPVTGIALITRTSHEFFNIPDGKYYVLACSIEKSFNPLHYFILDNCLRGRGKDVLHFPDDSNQKIDIYLRGPIPEIHLF